MDNVFECRTGSGYLVPIGEPYFVEQTPNDPRGNKNAVPMPEGYTNCNWVDEMWECTDEGAFKSISAFYSIFVFLSMILMMGNTV